MCGWNGFQTEEFQTLFIFVPDVKVEASLLVVSLMQSESFITDKGVVLCQFVIINNAIVSYM